MYMAEARAVLLQGQKIAHQKSTPQKASLIFSSDYSAEAFHNGISFCDILFYTIPYHTILYYTILYYTILYCTIIPVYIILYYYTGK